MKTASFMNRELFWAHKDSVAALGGKGFSVFSLPHLLWLAFCLAGIVCFTVIYRRSGDYRRDNIRKGISCLRFMPL